MLQTNYLHKIDSRIITSILY